MTDDLQPCPNPWCQGSNLGFRWELYSRQVVCYACGLKGPCSDTGQHGEAATMQDELDGQAIDRWNTRSDLQPQVKPLSWREGTGGDEYAFSTTGLAQYQVRETENNGWYVQRETYCSTVSAKGLPSIEDAMDAAQADYERRILSTLDLAPVTPAQAAIEALNDIACGRGMFGVDGEEDAQWATEYAATTLKAIKEGE